MKKVTNEEVMVEALAKSSHETWLRNKKADGYEYASISNEARKLNNNLLSWVELNDERREIDKEHVREQLKKLRDMGLEPEIIPEIAPDLAETVKQLGMCGYALVQVQ